MDVGAVVAFGTCAFLVELAGEYLMRTLAPSFVPFPLCIIVVVVDDVVVAFLALTFCSTVTLLVVLRVHLLLIRRAF